MQYKLVNVNNPKLPYATSDDLVTLWQMLDDTELKYKTPVIIDENKRIIAGTTQAFEWAKYQGFQL
jgi:hypothetical protein